MPHKSLMVLLTSLMILTGCASSAPHSSADDILPAMPRGEYTETINQFLRKDEKYSGFYNVYIVRALALNSQVQRATLQKKGHFLGWDQNKAQREREKMFQKMSSESDYFISFYSPNRHYDDLATSDSMWKIYLTSNGVRYEGKVEKAQENYSQLSTLYPFHSHFSTAYYVSFSVPMTAVEKQPNQLTLTSSLGSTTFQFPAVKD